MKDPLEGCNDWFRSMVAAGAKSLNLSVDEFVRCLDHHEIYETDEPVERGVCFTLNIHVSGEEGDVSDEVLKQAKLAQDEEE